MIRINLVPPEITQKRRSESRFAIMVLVFVIMLVLMGFFAAIMFVQVNAKADEVASARQELEALRLQSERFKVFEDTESDLQRRAELVVLALDGRVDWSRLCQEVSLVLPDDVWLTSLTANQESGATFVLRALDSLEDVPDLGHKAVARTLVRLTDLEQLFDVWLIASTRGSDIEVFEEGWIDFQVTAAVQEPESETTAEGEPAPPAESP